jgi:lysophospholipase L1-like esterase
VGSSIVHWAEQAARHDDPQLGLTKLNMSVKWIGRRGINMDDLDGLMDSLVKEMPKPQYIMIHCGSNDLTMEGISGKDLIEKIKCSTLRYQALFRDTKIIWSSILQRRYWHFAPLSSGKKIERKRSRVNSAIKRFIVANDGKYINNDGNISAKEVNLFHTDGTHLSSLGNSILLNNWKAALQSFFKESTDNHFRPSSSAGL